VQNTFSNKSGSIAQVESSSVIETSKRKPNAANQHVISRILDAFLKSILRNFVAGYVEDSSLVLDVSRKVGMNLMLISTVAQVYQIATNSVLNTKISELIFNNMLNKLLNTTLHLHERSPTNSILTNEKYKWNTSIAIYDELIREVMRDDVCEYCMNIVYDSEVMYTEIYKSTLLGPFLEDEIVTDCVIDVNASDMLLDSLLTSVVEKEILNMIRNSYYAKKQTCAVGNLLYSKFLIKRIAKEVADTRNKCFNHMKTVYSIYDFLITSEIKNCLRDFTEGKRIKMNTMVAIDYYNKMLMNTITFDIIQDIAKPIMLSTTIYSKIESKVCKQLLSAQVFNAKVVSAVFDGLLKRQITGSSNLTITNPITRQIANKLLLNVLNRLTKNITLNGIVVSSITSSVLAFACMKIVRRMGRNMMDDLVVEGLEVLERDEAPRIDLKLRTKEHHKLLSKMGTDTVKCRKCGILLSKQQISKHICQTSPKLKDVRSLDSINQELLQMLRKLEDKQIPFIKTDKLYNDFKGVVTSALKTNWNVPALERLELEPEKITKSNEARKYQVELAQFSEELITLMQEKIHALKQEEEFPCEEETEDQELVA
jgi:phage FluMu protein Com